MPKRESNNDLSSTIQKPTCRNVILFYESHLDMHPAKTILDLAKMIRNLGVKSLCFELPSELNKEESLKFHKTLHKQAKELYNNASNTVIQHALESGRTYTIGGKVLTSGTIFTDEEKKILLNTIREHDILMTASGLDYKLNNLYDLLKSIDAKSALIYLTSTTFNPFSFNFCAMDLPTASKSQLDSSDLAWEERMQIRNDHMFKKILEQCNQNGDVLALVGADHFKLAESLRDTGLKVIEYFISNEAPSIDELSSLCVRFNNTNNSPLCEGYHLHGLVIDLYNNPNLNAAKLVGEDLSKVGTVHEEL